MLLLLTIAIFLRFLRDNVIINFETPLILKLGYSVGMGVQESLIERIILELISRCTEIVVVM